MNQIVQNLSPKFYITAPAPCPYIDGRQERKVFAYLEDGKAEDLHNVLAQAGFRRSQTIAYKPVCEGCSACVSVRIRARDFQLKRSWRRILNRNSDLAVSVEALGASMESYDLLRSYIYARHGDGGMIDMSYEDFCNMIEDSPVDSYLVTYRLKDEMGFPRGKLLGLCIVDRLADGLSLVYSGFEPEDARRSLGTFIILERILAAKDQDLPFIYLGYWIADCQKMSYKARFNPLEVLTQDGWLEKRLSDSGH